MNMTDLCKELKNWFDRRKHFGTFTISDGTIMIDSLQVGQYFRIIGSVFNDGVYQYPATGLHDETFEGAIWEMAIPQGVIDLLSEINAWLDKYGEAVESPYQSESFGGYSYSLKGNGSAYNGSQGVTWQSQFKSKLNKWRKI